MTAIITLTIAGSDTGPFNIYSNLDDFTLPFEANVSKTSLQQGFTSSSVPNGTTIIRIKSTKACTNHIDVALVQPTTTTTSTTSTTTTTSIPSTTGTVVIHNMNEFGTNAFINGVKINNQNIVLDSGFFFPVQPGDAVTGSYVGNASDNQSVTIVSSHELDSPVSVVVQSSIGVCGISTGLITYSNLNLQTSPGLTIRLKPQGTAC